MGNVHSIQANELHGMGLYIRVDLADGTAGEALNAKDRWASVTTLDGAFVYRGGTRYSKVPFSAFAEDIARVARGESVTTKRLRSALGSSWAFFDKGNIQTWWIRKRYPIKQGQVKAWHCERRDYKNGQRVRKEQNDFSDKQCQPLSQQIISKLKHDGSRVVTDLQFLVRVEKRYQDKKIGYEVVDLVTGKKYQAASQHEADQIKKRLARNRTVSMVPRSWGWEANIQGVPFHFYLSPETGDTKGMITVVREANKVRKPILDSLLKKNQANGKTAITYVFDDPNQSQQTQLSPRRELPERLDLGRIKWRLGPYATAGFDPISNSTVVFNEEAVDGWSVRHEWGHDIWLSLSKQFRQDLTILYDNYLAVLLQQDFITAQEREFAGTLMQGKAKFSFDFTRLSQHQRYQLIAIFSKAAKHGWLPRAYSANGQLEFWADMFAVAIDDKMFKQQSSDKKYFGFLVALRAAFLTGKKPVMRQKRFLELTPSGPERSPDTAPYNSRFCDPLNWVSN